MTTTQALEQARALISEPGALSPQQERRISAALMRAYADGHTAMKGPHSAVDVERIRAEASALERGDA